MTSRTIKPYILLFAALAALQGSRGADVFYPGQAKVSVYKNIAGGTVGDLTSNPKYPNSPDEYRFFTNGDAGSNYGDNYGGRMEFLWIPPAAGSYQFAISGDDQSQLWVSTDETAANLKMVAREPEWNGVRAFGIADRRPGCGGTGGALPCENISQPITAAAGQRYYVVGLWKEGGGGDNFAVAVKPAGEAFADGDEAIPTAQIGVTTSDTPAPVGAPTPSSSFTYVGKTAIVTASIYQPPTNPGAVQWFKDGTVIAGETGSSITYTAVAADVNKDVKFKVKVGALESPETSVKVLADEANVDSPGFMTVEFFTGLDGVDINTLLNADKYINNQPDETRFVTSFSSPDGYGDNYGSRVSGFITPTVSGDYDFFIRADDQAQLFLSTDSNPANAVMIAQEVVTCCLGFIEPGAGEETTASPVTLVAGTKYAVYMIMKEGGGGDNAYAAWRRVGDTTPAASLPTLAGTVLSTPAEPAGATVTFTQQPSGSIDVEETKSTTLTAAATGFPINSVFYQWQKDGVDIPGAIGASYRTEAAVAGVSTKYRVVATTLANVKATSTEATVVGIPDTFAPKVTKAGSLRKGGKIEIGVGFDEAIQAAEASNIVNYAISAGTLDAVRYVVQDGSAVLVASGLTAGQTVTVTVKNINDAKGNAIPAAGVTRDVKITGTLNWVGVGADEANVAKSSTAFNDEAVAYSESDFDLISGGTANWDAYDEATYVYEEVTGDFDRVVRVEYQDPTSQWARAGLHIREALDEGTTREDATGGEAAVKPMSRNLSLRVNPSAGAAGGPANNLYEVIDRNTLGGVYRGTPGGFGGAPPYPNAWMRVARVGDDLKFWKSTDGEVWTNEGTLTWTEPELADKLFVGVYYAPEYNNNEILSADKLTRSALASFRDYGPWPRTTGGQPGPLTVARSATGITISWPAGQTATLESTTSLPGGWTAVAGAANPYSAPTTGAPTFYRLRQ